MENSNPQKCKAWVGFNVAMAHRITAGCDILLMPSRFEPCGLNQVLHVISFAIDEKMRRSLFCKVNVPYFSFWKTMLVRLLKLTGLMVLLPQLYAMHYGTVPVVHAVGGLRDTVQPYDPYQVGTDSIGPCCHVIRAMAADLTLLFRTPGQAGHLAGQRQSP